ncbi:MAG: VOC family protein [Candidatus Acidiferrales bacterium]
MTVKKITPVLLVDEVESCVRFWKERLGFEVAIEVPEGNQIGFVSLQKAGVELMYQSYASVEKDSSFRAQGYAKGPSFLYIEVDSLDDLIAATQGATVVMPERKAFYGAREIGVKDPAGHVLTFAQFGA